MLSQTFYGHLFSELNWIGTQHALPPQTGYIGYPNETGQQKKLRTLVPQTGPVGCIYIYAIGICKIHTHPKTHVVPPHAPCAEQDGDTWRAGWTAVVFTSFVRWSLTTPCPPTTPWSNPHSPVPNPEPHPLCIFVHPYVHMRAKYANAEEK